MTQNQLFGLCFAAVPNFSFIQQTYWTWRRSPTKHEQNALYDCQTTRDLSRNRRRGRWLRVPPPMVRNFYNSPLPGPLLFSLGWLLAKNALFHKGDSLLTLGSPLPSPPPRVLGLRKSPRSRVTSHTRRTETSPGKMVSQRSYLTELFQS